MRARGHCLSPLFLINWWITVSLISSILCRKEESLDNDGSYYGHHWVLFMGPGHTLHQVQSLVTNYGFRLTHTLFENAYSITNHNYSMLSSPLETWRTENAILTSPRVLGLDRQQVYQRTRRGDKAVSKSSPNPLTALQYYMGFTNINGNGLSLNVQGAWKQHASGRGVTIAIIDDGIDYLHPDLSRAYDAESSIDLNDDDNYPYPRYTVDDFNSHGTKCAGVMAADGKQGLCASGIAPDAKIAFIRLLDKLILTDTEEATALKHHNHKIDIYTASWGPEDDGRNLSPMEYHTRGAIETLIKDGRGGKGNILVWANGDGGVNDDCGADSFVISPYIISVAGVGREGKVPFFSETCSATVTSTFGGGIKEGIVTTSLYGSCDTSFAGTSASAPQAAGIFALALDVNPKLTWRDVQYIAILGSNVIVTKRHKQQDLQWEINGAGIAYHISLGFGLLNAGKVVRLAKQWRNVPERRTCRIPLVTKSRFFHAFKPVAFHARFPQDCATATHMFSVEHVQIESTLRVRHRGNLEMFVHSPSKSVSRLLKRRVKDDDVKKGFTNWPFMSMKFWGENPEGKWTVWFVLAASENMSAYGAIINSTLIINGPAESPWKHQRRGVKRILRRHRSVTRDKINDILAQATTHKRDDEEYEYDDRIEDLEEEDD